MLMLETCLVKRILGVVVLSVIARRWTSWLLLIGNDLVAHEKTLSGRYFVWTLIVLLLAGLVVLLCQLKYTLMLEGLALVK